MPDFCAYKRLNLPTKLHDARPDDDLFLINPEFVGANSVQCSQLMIWQRTGPLLTLIHFELQRSGSARLSAIINRSLCDCDTPLKVNDIAMLNKSSDGSSYLDSQKSLFYGV